MTHLQEQLNILKDSLSELAHIVKSQLKKSICALFDEDDDLANEVIFNEKRVNSIELKIDRDCERIFALLTPVAHDMRLVFATLKINADMERIGDYAEGIAKLVLLGKKGFDKQLVNDIQVKKMFDIAYAMFEDATTAYCENDSRLARSVFSRDVLLNDINHVATDLVADYCKQNPDNIHQSLYLLSIVRKLERVGDHITNIAEEVIFFKEAVILKHGNKSGEI